MSCLFLKESIRPGTPSKMISYILGNDSMSYGHLDHESTRERYFGHVIGQYIDFKKMDRLVKESRARLEAVKEDDTYETEARYTPLLFIHVG